MQITYQMTAVSKPQYMTEGYRNQRPVLILESDLATYRDGGWMPIGNATVTVDFLSDEQVASQQLGALNAELKVVRAENQRRENAILDQISKLQALTYVAA